MSGRVIICQCAQCKQPIFHGQRLRLIRETENDPQSYVAVTHCDCNNPDVASSIASDRKLPKITHGVGIH